MSGRSSRDISRGAIALASAGCLASCANTSIAPSYPGTLVLVADDATNTLLEIEPNSGHVRHRYDVEGPVVAVATARNGQYAATIDAQGDVVVCDLPRQGRDAAWRVDGGGAPTSLAFADRRSTLAAGFAGSGDVLLLGRESGRVEARIATGAGPIESLRIADGGDALLATRADGSSARLDVAQRRLATSDGTSTSDASITGPRARAHAVDDRVVATTSAATGELVVVEHGHGEPARIAIAPAEPAATRAWPVAIDPDGRLAFVSLPDAGRVVVVDLRARSVRGAYEIGGRPGAIAWTLMRAPSEFDVRAGGN